MTSDSSTRLQLTVCVSLENSHFNTFISHVSINHAVYNQLHFAPYLLHVCIVHSWVDWELEHLKIKTRLIDEKFASVMGGCRVFVSSSGHSRTNFCCR
jgi:hypothetical protein